MWGVGGTFRCNQEMLILNLLPLGFNLVFVPLATLIRSLHATQRDAFIDCCRAARRKHSKRSELATQNHQNVGLPMPSIISPQSEPTKCNYRRPQNPIETFQLIGFHCYGSLDFPSICFSLKVKINLVQLIGKTRI